MAKPGKKTESKLVQIMRKFKEEQLANGKSSKPAPNPEQAIAIGLSETHKTNVKTTKKSTK